MQFGAFSVSLAVKDIEASNKGQCVQPVATKVPCRMNDLNSLQSMGLTLPSPAYITGSILFGIVGYLVFRRGRNLHRTEFIWAGIALMVYPYAISETWMLWTVGAILSAWVYFKWN